MKVNNAKQLESTENVKYLIPLVFCSGQAVREVKNSADSRVRKLLCLG